MARTGSIATLAIFGMFDVEQSVKRGFQRPGMLKTSARALRILLMIVMAQSGADSQKHLK